MALKKQIILDNGIAVNYHRINSIEFMTNWTININISSYISEEQRNKEIQYQNIAKKQIRGEKLAPEEIILLNKPLNVFIEGDFLEIEYNENLSIKDIYEYLKTTEKYKDAADA